MASHYLRLTNIKILFKYNIYIPKIVSYFGRHTFEFKSQNCSNLKTSQDFYQLDFEKLLDIAAVA